MSEAEDLLAIYGAVDIAVQEDATGGSRSRVAAILPLYEYSRLQWYSDFLAWRREEDAQLPASLDIDRLESTAPALENLANTEPGSNRLAARRLLALYAASQANADVFGPGGELGDQVQGALGAVLRQRMEDGEEGVSRADEAARLLHEFMAEDITISGAQDADERWSELVSKVRLYVYVSGLEPRPCTGRLKKRRNVNGVVATLESIFDVYDVDFERAITFLAPENWPRCMDFWCRMNRIPPDDVHRYDELVSTNCPQPERAAFTAHAYLDFKFERLPNEAMAGYTLAPVRQPSDGLIVDEGSLTVTRKPGFLRVWTTKAVQFNRAFSGEQLAMISCALGWTEKGKDMMYNCARLPEDDLQRARRRPPDRVSRGGELPGGRVPARSSTGGPASRGSRRRTTPGDALISEIARQTAEAMKDCVDDQTEFMEQWADRAADEDYGYQDMADDMARAGVRMVMESARIMDLAVRNARLGAAVARRRPTARAAQPDNEEERPSWTTTRE